MLNRSRSVSCLLAVSVLAATLGVPGGAFASRGSIEPMSYVRVSLGADTYATDLAFTGANVPCILAGAKTAADVPTTRLACGFRLASRATIDASAHPDFPTAFDASNRHLDIIGWSEPSRSAQRPFLVRTSEAGVPDASFGVGGVANLDGLAPSGLQRVRLFDVETLADDSVLVTGNASAGESGDLVSFVAKLAPTGSLDPSFGTGGVTEIRVPGYARSMPNDLRVTDDGTVMVVGWSSTAPDATFFPFAALLDASGIFVPTFGTAGIAQPSLGAAVSFASMADGARGGGFPIPVSGSINVRGSVRPFVVRLQRDGSVAGGWGGPATQKISTISGHPRALQSMDIEVFVDRSVIGAAEMDANGDYDSLVSHFRASDGRLDMTWATGGFEPIDTVPGVVDDEWSAAITMEGDTYPWIAGTSRVGRTSFVHLYRLRRASGNPQSYAWAGADVVALTATGSIRPCGSTLRRACRIPRGVPFRIGAGVSGWDSSGSPLLRPTLRIWSKAPRGEWKMREQVGVPRRNGAAAVVLTTLRLGAGIHEIYVHRNGSTTFGAAWSRGLHVTVG